jgi:hypothetical protein
MLHEPTVDGYEIAPITPQDLGAVMELVNEESWRGYSVEDLALVMSVSPELCFKLVHDGRLVGSVIALAVPKMAYVSFFLIHKAHRQFKSAMALGQRCVTAAAAVSQTIVIYGNPRAVNAYTRVGFHSLHPVTRFRASALDAGAGPAPDAGGFAQVSVDQVLELDRACYRTDRSRLLRALLLYTGACYYGYYPEGSGNMAAYAFVRRNADDYIVGPLVATSAGAASELLRHILTDIPPRALWLELNNESILAANPEAIAFKRTRVTVHKMFMGNEQSLEDDGMLFGLGGHHFS